MGYVQEFSITGAGGPCRMFILSKRLQLGTSLRNYSEGTVEDLNSQTCFTHTDTYGQIHLASDNKLT